MSRGQRRRSYAQQEGMFLTHTEEPNNSPFLVSFLLSFFGAILFNTQYST